MLCGIQGRNACEVVSAEAHSGRHCRGCSAGGSLLACTVCIASPAAAKDIKVCLIAGKTGPLEAYAKQTETGFMMGLEYLTKGTMKVGDDKLEVIVKDDQLKPDRGKSLLEECYGDDKADIAVGTTGSPVALAMLPVAEENEEDPDRRAGGGRLASPATSGTATSSAPAAAPTRTRWPTPPPSRQAATCRSACSALDTAFGRDGVAAFKTGAGRRPAQGQGRRRGIRRRQHDRLRAVRRAPVRRAEGQARQEDHRLHLGRRRIRWPSSST